jgi:outer membrane murein-binding lipoprotein Lpp
MWIKALIKWLLKLFKTGQTVLAPFVDDTQTNQASAFADRQGSHEPSPVSRLSAVIKNFAGFSLPFGGCHTEAPHDTQQSTLLDLAADMAELRSEIRALRAALSAKATSS